MHGRIHVQVLPIALFGLDKISIAFRPNLFLEKIIHSIDKIQRFYYVSPVDML